MIFTTLLLLALILIIFLLFIIIFLSQILASFFADAPFIPIPKNVRDKIIKNLDLKNDSIFYDLGCGDGRILIDAAKVFPNVKIIGIDIAFIPYLLAKFNTGKYKNIEIKRENIFKINLGDTTHIFTYLMPEAMEKLLPKLKKECGPGTKIISCDFEFKNLKPNKIVDFETSQFSRGQKLFIYTI